MGLGVEMAVPHCFPSLVHEPTTQCVLIAGAGLSFGVLPIAQGLKRELDKLAQSRGVAPSGDLYELAEAVLASLVGSGKSEPEARLYIAEELGLLDDRLWFGETGLPLSGNTPRHRTLARFAVEQRLKAVVSLNWDTLLEAALDSVGLAEGPRPLRPWPITARASIVDDAELPRLTGSHIFPVIKPHGCVRNLEELRRQYRFTGEIPSVVFKITKSELDTFPLTQSLVDQKVQSYLSECPLLAVGWKATEGYLRNTVIETAKRAPHPEGDAFTLANRSWYFNATAKPAETYHDEIAAAYSKSKDEAFVRVGNEEELDSLFLWLQARYALNKLISASLAQSRTALQTLLQQLDQPVLAHFVPRWVDGWLPIWVRLCWRIGAMQGYDPYTNQRIEPWDIPVIPRDVHVPFAGMALERRDLLAAAKLLVTLGDALSEFDFNKYPGGLWSASNRELYIPLPGWRGTAQTADLAALKPLTEALRGLGFVRKIFLVWLDPDGGQPSQADSEQLAAMVGRLMPLASFAAEDALTWIDLEAMKGVPHAAMD